MSTIVETKAIFKALVISFFALSFLLLSPGIEFGVLASGTTSATSATSSTAIQNILCNAVNQLTGGIGRAIAIIVIISSAFMLFLGKISWGLGISIAIAMGLLFGAGSVVNMLSGSTTVSC